MKKKLIACMLVVSLAVSMSACGGTAHDNGQSGGMTSEEETEPADTVEKTDGTEEDRPGQETAEEAEKKMAEGIPYKMAVVADTPSDGSKNDCRYTVVTVEFGAPGYYGEMPYIMVGEEKDYVFDEEDRSLFSSTADSSYNGNFYVDTGYICQEEDCPQRDVINAESDFVTDAMQDTFFICGLRDDIDASSLKIGFDTVYHYENDGSYDIAGEMICETNASVEDLTTRQKYVHDDNLVKLGGKYYVVETGYGTGCDEDAGCSYLRVMKTVKEEGVDLLDDGVVISLVDGNGNDIDLDEGKTVMFEQADDPTYGDKIAVLKVGFKAESEVPYEEKDGMYYPKFTFADGTEMMFIDGISQNLFD
jgi:hypothetical protein